MAILMLLMMTAQSPAAAGDCSPAQLQSLEAELGRVTAEAHEQDGVLGGLRAEMADLSGVIDEARADAESVRGRRRLEGLLRDSRKLANDMSSVDARVRVLQQRVADIEERLFVCYRAQEIATLDRLLEALRAQGEDEVLRELGNLERIETRLRTLQVPAAASAEPLLGADANAATTEAERGMLADALLDYTDRAVRDTIRTHERLVDAQQTLKRKQELKELLKDAGRTGMSGGGFFEGLDNVDSEVERAQKEVSTLQGRLEQLRHKIAFYASQLAILSGDGKESPR